MNPLIDQLAQSVLQKRSIHDCSVQELQQMAEQYPYSGAIQLLLAEKLKGENSSQYQDQLQKVSLYFQNPLWLDYLLNNNGDATVITTPQQESILEKEIKVDPANPITAGTELSFEPYYTVDYFASQGIKFKQEEKPADKFGQQLKSFTEWLKTLKKLPASEVTQITDSNAGKKIEQLAEHSVEDREVITEAMAEVWQKQGNHDKAIEVYYKLSLLDPSKNSYFAAKIEQLKK